MHLKTQVSARINRGKKRDYNEDYASYFEPESPFDLKRSGKVYVVADGVGRSSKGDLASRYAVQNLLYEYYEHPGESVRARLETYIQQAGNEINSYAEESGVFRRMATTLVAAVIRGNNLTVANVGDSRAYLFRDGEIKQITQDHALVAEMLRNGTLTPEEAEKSSLKNRITRSLGGERDVKVDLFFDINLEPGDKVLLCSDGLSRYAVEEDLARMMREGTPDQISSKLICFANQKGGEDNITALLVEVGEEVEEAAPARVPGGVPQPVDWESLETQPSVPAGVVWGEGKKRKRRVLPYLAGLGVLITLAVFLATPFGRTLWMSPALTSTTEEQGVVAPTQQPTGTSIPSTPTMTALPSQTPTLRPTSTPMPTSTPTLPAAATCVYRYQQPEPGVNSLYLLLLNTFQKDIPYLLFINEYAPRVTCAQNAGSDCDYDPVEAYEWVKDGWLLKLPDIDPQKCREEGGTVVLEE